jgi:hypothetical protein
LRTHAHLVTNLRSQQRRTTNGLHFLKRAVCEIPWKTMPQHHIAFTSNARTLRHSITAARREEGEALEPKREAHQRFFGKGTSGFF